MWSLWIISIIIDSTDPKITMYGKYKEAWQCEDNWRLLNYEFTKGEIAFCETIDDVSGR
jgi:hypothetical protein